MENIYQLTEKFRRISDAYDETKGILEEAYEENGGEITEETEALQGELDELARMKEEIVSDVLSCPDDYAMIVKNTEAQKRVLEAELKAVKEEQAKVLAKIQSKIKRKEDKIAWFKENISEAMKLAQKEKLGGAKTDSRFTIWFSESTSLDVNTELVLDPYQAKINELISELPAWVTVKTDVNKTILKKEETLPLGAERIKSKSLQIR